MAEGKFSREIVVDNLPVGEEQEIRFAADPAEREALARRLNLPAIVEFSAQFQLLRQAGGRVKAAGSIRARVTRICVVTLEPFETDVDEPVSLDFAPESEAEAEASRQAHQPLPGRTMAELPDPPDPIIGGRIDLGALAAEFLSLGLDPYPRKPGVDFEAPEGDAPGEESPFAALGKLRRPER